MTLDEPLSEDLILDIVSTIFKESKVKPEIKVEKGSSIGEGFFGITSSVQVRVGEKVKHLFIKMTSQNKRIRSTLSLEILFEREADFYLELRPILNEIYLKYLKKSFDITTTCLFVKKDYLKEAIVFENIRVSGYSNLKGKETLGKDHLMLALKTYSYLHACGFIMKKDYLDKFKEMIKSKPDIHLKSISVFGTRKVILLGLDMLRRHCCDIQDKAIVNNFDKIKNKILKVDNYGNDLNEYSTITHMDCWKNNLMFKYKGDSNELEDLKLVDMQMWTITSPVIDILYVIYTNISEEESSELLYFCFNYYYESLCRAILEMDGDPKDLYPVDIYTSDLRKYCYYGLFMTFMVLRPILADLEGIPNVAEMVLQDQPLSETFNFDLPNEEYYCKKIKMVLRHFIKRNML